MRPFADYCYEIFFFEQNNYFAQKLITNHPRARLRHLGKPLQMRAHLVLSTTLYFYRLGSLESYTLPRRFLRYNKRYNASTSEKALADARMFGPPLLLLASKS